MLKQSINTPLNYWFSLGGQLLTNKFTVMTILEFVSKQKPANVNAWIELIKNNGLSKHESIILSCADQLNLITCDLSQKPNFINTITL